MVYMQNSISVCNSIDQILKMANCVNSSDFNPKSGQKKIPSSPNCSKIPCEGSRFRSAVIDLVILLAVMTACGFLLFPYVKVVIFTSIEIFVPVFYLVKEEVIRNPIIYASIGLSFCCIAMVVWIIILCTTRKCGNPNCKGLRNAAEFDIQLETEELVKESGGGSGVKKWLFELHRDHHRELEAELKKMAPPNGRAVLIFRARCGCSVGRLEVPGLKKHKKIKK